VSSAKLAFIVAAALVGVAVLLRAIGFSFWGLVFAVGVAALVMLASRHGVRGLEALSALRRQHTWGREEGRFHAFGGVPLQVHDDGRHVWLGGAGLLRVLGRKEPDDVLAARMPGQWRRDDEGALLLRVDAVIDYLAHMPGRDDPRVQKLRRYLERDVAYPAAERRRRG
jgi:hypothetical protein